MNPVRTFISPVVIVLLAASSACSLDSPEQTRLPAGALPAAKQQEAPSRRAAERDARRAGQETPVAGEAMHLADQAGMLAGRAVIPAASVSAELRTVREPLNRENYHHFSDNPLQRVAENPFSTFSIDVDTGAYSNVRRMLAAGSRPAADAVRTEELINYFSYDYPLPQDRATPFTVSTELGPTPWNPHTHLLQIGIQGYVVDAAQLPPANLVFLVDVSGSMRAPNKLELLKSGLKLLTRQLDADDRVSIVVYAGASGLVLEPTAGNRTADISAALDALDAGGSTNGAAGIRQAYAVARQAFIRDGINRVILATDGDFNVGTVNFDMLKQLVAEQRASGISLTTLGFGAGNYNDHLMEQLADAGNGNHAYIDSLGEANKVLVDELASTLMTIAQDVKIQVEFNPATVTEYRLVGYENRALRREDFSNDRVDAGEIGAGHSVTAIYEIALTGSQGVRLDAGRYRQPVTVPQQHADELAQVRVRYKLPGAVHSRLIDQPVMKAALQADLAAASDRYRFAAAVAGFGQLLRGGTWTGSMGYDDVLALARSARGADPFGYRGEFLQLVNLAAAL